MTSTEIAAASKVMLGTTEAVAMYIGSTKIWPTNTSQPHDYSLDYFTIESLEDNNTIKWVKNGGPTCSISYSTDNGTTWTDLTLSSNTDLTTINTGDKVIFKGTNVYLATAWDRRNSFSGTKNFNAYGNAMSLLFGDNFTSNSEFNSANSHQLCGLFYGTTTLISAENLILPATTLTPSSYNGMFRGCTNLEVAPEIDLVSMSDLCCKRMFCMNRNSKVTTPKMTKSPILRCPTTATSCYEEMFNGNGNLIEVTCLKTDNTDCCKNWMSNTASSGTFIKSPLKTNWDRNNSGIPSGWTVEDYVES